MLKTRELIIGTDELNCCGGVNSFVDGQTCVGCLLTKYAGCLMPVTCLECMLAGDVRLFHVTVTSLASRTG